MSILTKQIKQVLAKAGVIDLIDRRKCLFYYNDRRVNGRRLKWMGNAVCKDKQVERTAEVKQLLNEAGIPFKKVGYRDCDSFRGVYQSFVVHLND